MSTLIDRVRLSLLLPGILGIVVVLLPIAAFAHHTDVHGGGVNNDTQRSLTIDAHEVWNNGFSEDAQELARPAPAIMTSKAEDADRGKFTIDTGGMPVSSDIKKCTNLRHQKCTTPRLESCPVWPG